jgi:hypothetical protein
MNFRKSSEIESTRLPKLHENAILAPGWSILAGLAALANARAPDAERLSFWREGLDAVVLGHS